MPITYSQCTRYMKLYKARPDYVSNVDSSQHLDINNELKMLTVSDEIEEEVRETAEWAQKLYCISPLFQYI